MVKCPASEDCLREERAGFGPHLRESAASKHRQGGRNEMRIATEALMLLLVSILASGADDAVVSYHHLHKSSPPAPTLDVAGPQCKNYVLSSSIHLPSTLHFTTWRRKLCSAVRVTVCTEPAASARPPPVRGSRLLPSMDASWQAAGWTGQHRDGARLVQDRIPHQSWLPGALSPQPSTLNTSSSPGPSNPKIIPPSAQTDIHDARFQGLGQRHPPI